MTAPLPPAPPPLTTAESEPRRMGACDVSKPSLPDESILSSLSSSASPPSSSSSSSPSSLSQLFPSCLAGGLDEADGEGEGVCTRAHVSQSTNASKSSSWSSSTYLRVIQRRTKLPATLVLRVALEERHSIGIGAQRCKNCLPVVLRFELVLQSVTSAAGHTQANVPTFGSVTGIMPSLCTTATGEK